jgi:hypothetical protein
MFEGKATSRFKFTLHKVERPSDWGNVKGQKINIKCIMDIVSWSNGLCAKPTLSPLFSPPQIGGLSLLIHELKKNWLIKFWWYKLRSFNNHFQRWLWHLLHHEPKKTWLAYELFS